MRGGGADRHKHTHSLTLSHSHSPNHTIKPTVALQALCCNAQSGWSRDGSSQYHNLLFSPPTPQDQAECESGEDAFGLANHALSRLNFYRRWANAVPAAYDAQLMADAQQHADTTVAPAQQQSIVQVIVRVGQAWEERWERERERSEGEKGRRGERGEREKRTPT